MPHTLLNIPLLKFNDSGYTPSMTWRNRLFWFICGALFAAASCSSYCMYQVVQTVLHDPYYVEHTAAYVINYMKSHSNHWPTSWDDLYQANIERVESGNW